MKIKNLYNLFKVLSKIPKDKLLHFAYGYIGFILLSFFMAPSYALLVVAITAGLKEYADDKGYGTFEILDFTATTLPGVLHIIVTNYA